MTRTRQEVAEALLHRDANKRAKGSYSKDQVSLEQEAAALLSADERIDGLREALALVPRQTWAWVDIHNRIRELETNAAAMPQVPVSVRPGVDAKRVEDSTGASREKLDKRSSSIVTPAAAASTSEIVRGDTSGVTPLNAGGQPDEGDPFEDAMRKHCQPAPLAAPTPEQIEAFRKEHHIPGDDIEDWAVEENMVLAYLCASPPSPAGRVKVSEEVQEWRKDAERYTRLVGLLFQHSLHFRGTGNEIQLCTNSTVLSAGPGADAAIDAILASEPSGSTARS